MSTVMTWCAGAIGLQVSAKNNWKPGKDNSESAFKEWTAKLHCALKPILWEVWSNTYTMFKIENTDHGHGLRASSGTRRTNARKMPKEKPQPNATPRPTVKNRRRRNQRKPNPRRNSLRKKLKRKKTNCTSKYTWQKGEGGELLVVGAGKEGENCWKGVWIDWRQTNLVYNKTISCLIDSHVLSNCPHMLSNWSFNTYMMCIADNMLFNFWWHVV